MDYSSVDKFIDRIVEESTPAAPLWNTERAKTGKSAAPDFGDGCLMSALYAYYKSTGDKKYLKFIDDFVDGCVADDGAMQGYSPEDYDLEYFNAGRILFDLYRETCKDKYIKAIDVLGKQLGGQPRTAIGDFWYKKVYPNQVLLEGLYAAQVFYTRYETEYNRGKNYADILKQFKNVYENMYDKDKKLYFHGLDYSRTALWSDAQTGLSKSFYLRAIAYFAAGLADAIGYMDRSRPDLKAELITVFRRTIVGLEQYIDPVKHMFWQVVDAAGKDGNYLETSGSALIAYAMLRGARFGYVDKRFAEVGKSIFDGVCTEYLTETDGKLNLGGICLWAGLGPEDRANRNGTFEYYVSQPTAVNDAKGVAPLIAAYTEVKRLIK